MATDRRIMESGRTEVLEEDVALPDGRPAIWLSTKSPLRDAHGAVVGLIGSSIDFTEQSRARALLARSQEELEREISLRTEERDRLWRNSQDLLLVARFDGNHAFGQSRLEPRARLERYRPSGYEFHGVDPSR